MTNTEALQWLQRYDKHVTCGKCFGSGFVVIRGPHGGAMIVACSCGVRR